MRVLSSSKPLNRLNWLFIILMQGGSDLILLARRVDALSKVVADCAAAHKEAGHQLGGKFATVQLDVSDRQQIANLWSRVPECSWRLQRPTSKGCSPPMSLVSLP